MLFYIKFVGPNKHIRKIVEIMENCSHRLSVFDFRYEGKMYFDKFHISGYNLFTQWNTNQGKI